MLVRADESLASRSDSLVAPTALVCAMYDVGVDRCVARPRASILAVRGRVLIFTKTPGALCCRRSREEGEARVCVWMDLLACDL